MRKDYGSVELLGVPNYYQGSHDSLCTYYAAAMLLATLHPEYQNFFGRGARRQGVGLKVEDPLVKNFPRSKKASNDRVLSSWFYGGADLEDACKALKATMKEGGLGTQFRYKLYNHTMGTFEFIADSIGQGLPVMIGWNTVDFGVHCALVVGYREADRHWLILHDPTLGYEDVCWEVLKDIDKSRLALVSVGYHDGPRPDCLMVDKYGSTQVDRWWPYQGGVCYRPIDELYKMAKGDSLRETE